MTEETAIRLIDMLKDIRDSIQGLMVAMVLLGIGWILIYAIEHKDD